MPSYVHGLEDLNKKLDQLPDRMQKNVHTAAVRGAAREYIKISRSNLGGGYNTLKKALKIKKLRSKRRNIKFRVHPERGKGVKYDAYYAHIVEFGTFKKNYDITPWKSKGGEGKKALKFEGMVFGKVKHPGIRPTRFMSRAISKESRMIDALLKRGRRAFERQIAKSWLRSNR